jgi:hypothetical protein
MKFDKSNTPLRRFGDEWGELEVSKESETLVLMMRVMTIKMT